MSTHQGVVPSGQVVPIFASLVTLFRAFRPFDIGLKPGPELLIEAWRDRSEDQSLRDEDKIAALSYIPSELSLRETRDMTTVSGNVSGRIGDDSISRAEGEGE